MTTAHMGSSHRLEGLDALRGIAAVSVMLYHYTMWYHHPGAGHVPPGLSMTFTYGNLGVDLFFIISGFVILMTLERTRTLTDFLASRFARLYPAFLASLIFTLAVRAALDDPDRVRGMGALLANLTMMPELFGMPMADGSYWSLYYEIDFYLLAGCTFFLLRPASPELPCAVWLLASLAMRLRGAEWVPAQVVLFTTAQFSQLFVIGAMLYRIRSNQATLFTWAVLALALMMTLVSRYWAFKPLPPQGYMALISLFAGAVWLAAIPRGRIPMIGPLRFLGRISYPLYLIHQQAGAALISWLEEAGVIPDLAVAITIVVVILAAWGISVFVEYPAQRWVRSRYGVWRGRRARAVLSAG